MYSLTNISGDGVNAGTATLSIVRTSGNSSLHGKLLSHDLLCSQDLEHLVILSLAIHQQFRTHSCPHHFIIANDASETLDSSLTSVFLHGIRSQCALHAARPVFIRDGLLAPSLLRWPPFTAVSKTPSRSLSTTKGLGGRWSITTLTPGVSTETKPGSPSSRSATSKISSASCLRLRKTD